METKVTLDDIMAYLKENMSTKEDVAQIRRDMTELKAELKGDISELRLDLRKTEHRILDHMSDQLGILKGDIIAMLRRGDCKIDELIDVLKVKEILTT